MPGPLLDPDTADGRFWAFWKAWPREGTEAAFDAMEPGRDRDLMVFVAGAAGACHALYGDEFGGIVADHLAAGAFLRREMERKTGNGEGGRGAGPDQGRGPQESSP